MFQWWNFKGILLFPFIL